MMRMKRVKRVMRVMMTVANMRKPAGDDGVARTLDGLQKDCSGLARTSWC